MRRGFTLIELLVVIAIIAVLSVVVVLSLNPAELLRQSRDANRLSDLSTLNSALALYTTDQAGIAGFSLGNASSVYVSLPDSSSTCGTWNLPTLPSGYTYNCVSSTSTKSINNTGWIPVSFSSISGGAPFSNLPLDNVNQSSTGLYYVYYTNGSQYEATAVPESQKQKSAYGAKPTIQNYPDVLANGSNFNISPLFNTSGLMGYWPMDEGTGSNASDTSGNSNNCRWQGTAAGSGNTYYSGGKVGPWTGYFSGVDTVCWQNSAPFRSMATFSFFSWVKTPGLAPGMTEDGIVGITYFPTFDIIGGLLSVSVRSGSTSYVLSETALPSLFDNAWHFVGFTFDGTNLNLYRDGIMTKTRTAGQDWQYSNSFYIGDDPNNSMYYFNGSIDDARIYSRVLSSAEIQALYNAEK